MPDNSQKASNNKMAIEFINAAKGFESAEIVRVHKSAKIAWRISGACLLITGLAVGAVAGLTPLKETRPYVIKVDNNTGQTEIVTMMKNQEQSYGEVMDKHWLTRYVQLRESYDWVTIQDNYDAVMLMSSPEIQAAFSKIYNDKGNKALAPTAAYDNGRFTYFSFDNGRELPLIYKVMADGTEMLLNSHVEGDTVVIHETAKHFVLRLGKSVLGLENRSFDEQGTFNRTGTGNHDFVRISREKEGR